MESSYAYIFTLDLLCLSRTWIKNYSPCLSKIGEQFCESCYDFTILRVGYSFSIHPVEEVIRMAGFCRKNENRNLKSYLLIKNSGPSDMFRTKEYVPLKSHAFNPENKLQIFCVREDEDL